MAAILSRPQCVNFEVNAALADHLELFGPANIYWYNGHLVCMLCVFTETAFKGRYSLQWRHNERDGVSNPGVSIVCLNVCSKKISKPRVSGFVRESTGDS